MRIMASWLCGLLLCCAGCRAVTLLPAAGEYPTEAAADASAARARIQTIPVELVFVRCEEHDPALGDALWNETDEQVLDDGLRRRLAANGLRAGIVTGGLPADLATRLSPDRPTAADIPAADGLSTGRLLRLLPGRRSEVVAAASIGELVLLESLDGQVRGGTYHEAGGSFSLRVQPAADGRVQVELVPEIRHGPMERSWVGEDGMFRLEAGQRRHRREDLMLRVELAAGSVLVVGGAGDEAATLGDALLRDRKGDRATRRLLLIRPLGRSVDPMFCAAVAPADDAVLEVR